MAQENLFNAFSYFENLGQTNRLARDNHFLVGFCSGPDGVEDAISNFRQSKNFILVDDTTSQNTYSNGVGFFRRDVYTVFIVAAFHMGDMADRQEKLDLCRRIFRQMHSRLIHDKDSIAWGDALEYLKLENIYSNEFPGTFLDGMTGLYFMVQNEEPIDLQYDDKEWTDR